MPNGFHGPKEEWDKREAPYLRIDPTLSGFAERHGVELYKNYRDADRSLRFNDALSRTIWIHATDLYGANGTCVGAFSFYMYERWLAFHERPSLVLRVVAVALATLAIVVFVLVAFRAG